MTRKLISLALLAASFLSAQTVAVKRRQVLTPGLATPTFSPDTGTYSGTQTVTPTIPALSTGCYTTDGSTPAATTPGTCSTGTTYTSGTITISATTTLKMIATQAGYTNSAVKSATYTITLSVSDTFTGSAGALSSNWELVYGSTALQIDGSGHAIAVASFAESGMRWKTTVNAFPADQYAELVVNTTTADVMGPMVRMSGTGTGYFARIISGAPAIVKHTGGGSYTILRSNSECNGVTVTAPDTVRLKVIGTTLTLYKNGTMPTGCTVTDSTYSTGQPGILMSKSSTTSSADSWTAVGQ